MSDFLKVKGETNYQDTGFDFNESGNKYFGSNASLFDNPSVKLAANVKKIAIATAVCVGLIFIIKRVKK